MQAIIDLGTNTFHLLIAEVKNKTIIEYYKLQVPVMIGKNGINDGKLSDDAYKRGMTALAEFRKYIDQFEVKKIKAFATSAIRNAQNGDDFINDVLNQFQISIEKITGDDEAKYIYEGVKNSFVLPDKNILVMDIGGGSVEFIIGRKEEIIWKQSFELGAARLLQHFKPSDPISETEINDLINYFELHLSPLKNKLREFHVSTLVGSAGSFETLLDVVLRDFAVIPNALSKHAFEIRNEDFEVFYEIMITSTIAQRSKLKGMVDFRIEMIVVSAILMKYVYDKFEMNRIIASDYSLKEGILLYS